MKTFFFAIYYIRHNSFFPVVSVRVSLMVYNNFLLVYCIHVPEKG